MPSSRMKADIARILTEEGFVEAYGVTDDKPQPNLVIRLKYRPRRQARHYGPGAREQAGPAHLYWISRDSVGAQWSGHQYPDHAQGSHDRSSGSTRAASAAR